MLFEDVSLDCSIDYIKEINIFGKFCCSCCCYSWDLFLFNSLLTSVVSVVVSVVLIYILAYRELIKLYIYI